MSSLIFGAITCVTGLLGVVIGAATTRLCRQKTERADPLVCAVSMLGSAIFICLIFVVAKKSIVGAYVRVRHFNQTVQIVVIRVNLCFPASKNERGQRAVLVC